MLWSFTETVAYGATRNPWNTDYTPGGSSGGSGAAVAAGLAPMAVGSDGMGSIRIPSTWCGLFGISPARPSAAGAARRRMERPERERADVEDRRGRRALPRRHHDDARADGLRRRGRPRTGTVTIRVEHRLPPLLVARIGRAQRAAVQEAGELLRELGHDVIERDPDYPTSSIVGQALPRYFRGAYDDVQTLPHPERLEARTREFARIGGLFSDRRMKSIRAAESEVAQRVQSIFDDVDVVVTPGTAAGPSRIGAYQKAGRHIDSSHGGLASAFPGAVQRDRAACGSSPVGPRR